MKKDIVITLPAKISWKEYEKELAAVKDGSKVLNFKVPYFPKDTEIGRKCYLVHKGHIVGWMKIVGMVEKDFTCEITGKKWTGKFIQRSGPFFKCSPIPMKGFQGFRYIN